MKKKRSQIQLRYSSQITAIANGGVKKHCMTHLLEKRMYLLFKKKIISFLGKLV